MELIFKSVVIEALDWKGILNTLKKVTSTMECADVAAFTFAMWQIRLGLLSKLISPEAIVINLFANLRV